MIRLLLIRHGATAGNLERRYVGKTDEPLCDLGRLQIIELKNRDFSADVLFTSPMARTRQTAAILFPDLSPRVVEDFRETDFGLFEGKTAAELSNCPQYRRWVESMCLGQIPGGERVEAFKERCRNAFVKAAAAVPDGQTAAFVLHGGVIMAILEAFGWPRGDFYGFHLGNGEYLWASYDGEKIYLK